MDGAPWDRARAIAFMHIPKAAGTALRVALERTLKPRQLVFGLCRGHFGGFEAFATMAPHIRGHVYVTPEEVPRGLDMIVGHISDGFLRQAYPDADFVTLLREPRARLLSLWESSRTLTTAFLAPWGDWAERVQRAHRPLGVFLADRELACLTDNAAVRMLVGPHPLIPPDDVIAPAADAVLIAAALARLRRYSFVDLVENPAVGANLAHWLGRPMPLARVNATAGRLAALGTRLDRELDLGTIDLLAARGRLDAALWRAVVLDRMRDVDPGRLADAAFATTVARHAAEP
jgi:hypothetical protein